jgi:hypothetical protein
MNESDGDNTVEDNDSSWLPAGWKINEDGEIVLPDGSIAPSEEDGYGLEKIVPDGSPNLDYQYTNEDVTRTPISDETGSIFDQIWKGGSSLINGLSTSSKGIIGQGLLSAFNGYQKDKATTKAQEAALQQAKEMQKLSYEEYAKRRGLGGLDTSRFVNSDYFKK